jgi:hypothetical protein
MCYLPKARPERLREDDALFEIHTDRVEAGVKSAYRIDCVIECLGCDDSLEGEASKIGASHLLPCPHLVRHEAEPVCVAVSRHAADEEYFDHKRTERRALVMLAFVRVGSCQRFRRVLM